VPGKYKAFPNPAKDLVQIEGATESDIITMYNVVGTLVKKVNGNKIDVSDISEGSYFLKINNEDTIQLIK
jgi:hypothetical protein